MSPEQLGKSSSKPATFFIERTIKKTAMQAVCSCCGWRSDPHPLDIDASDKEWNEVHDILLAQGCGHLRAVHPYTDTVIKEEDQEVQKLDVTPQRSLIIAINQMGQGFALCWGDDEVIKWEVEATSVSLDDLKIPNPPIDPGLYRWNGIVLYDGSEDGDPEWLGSFSRINFPEWIQATKATA